MIPIVNNAMTLYVSNVRGRKFNTSYPFEARIQGVDDLARAAQYDHVCAQYGDAKNRAGETIKAHRGIKDFMRADCAAMDCDNSQPDPMQPDLSPDEWKTPDDVAAAFPGVAFYAVPSRNHMREKDGLPARPKYHYYFPLKHTVKNADSWAALKKGMREHFPAFDENAIDAARFLYGVENPQPVFHAGDLCVDEFMEIQKSAQRARATQEKAAQERRQANSGVIPVGQRNSTLSRFAATVKSLMTNGLNAGCCACARAIRSATATLQHGLWKLSKPMTLRPRGCITTAIPRAISWKKCRCRVLQWFAVYRAQRRFPCPCRCWGQT